MKRITALVVLLMLLTTLFFTQRSECSACASTSTSEVSGNCVIQHWVVCCEGPGAGEVSCFTYDQVVCVPIIN